MNSIDPKLMEVLVCPVSKKPLVQKGDELICKESSVGCFVETIFFFNDKRFVH